MAINSIFKDEKTLIWMEICDDLSLVSRQISRRLINVVREDMFQEYEELAAGEKKLYRLTVTQDEVLRRLGTAIKNELNPVIELGHGTAA